MSDKAPRFQRTYCSQCGGEFGPGSSGFSLCSDHRALDTARLIERLRTRNGNAAGFGLGPVCDWAADRIEADAAELEALRKDAARYRWLQRRTAGLRDNEGRQYFSFPSMFGLRPVGNIMQGSVGQHLDAAIDAAMGEKP